MRHLECCKEDAREILLSVAVFGKRAAHFVAPALPAVDLMFPDCDSPRMFTPKSPKFTRDEQRLISENRNLLL